MANALFYILSDARLEAFACEVVARAYRKGQGVYLHCADQAQAHRIDDLLWQFDPDRFIPHNLVGEGPRGGGPVVVGWQDGDHAKMEKRPLLVNLSPDVPQFAVQFTQIIDFVPADEQAKAQARKRFAAYRQLGVNPTTQDLARQPF
ncbi:DNA polymerase III subunit chi [Ferrimonas marina]|uniref:DNA polymerase III, chi subunit n=1 Tax=Ferrimonas marina TaxID=299255 RepID=A0A1M5X8G6_9GAMM|nr:DNA polymerase III subunit chi [Ferrimonas marina]SHH96127.1 DNA polymerase III, chi subunit [Ferrimonas marina]